MNKKRKIQLIIRIVAVFAFCLAGALIGYATALSGKVTFSDEKKQYIDVEFEKDLIDNITSLYNDVIVLESDITIKDLKCVVNEEQQFIGEFNGKGHTVTVENFSEPLFRSIGENGYIHDVEFVFKNIILPDDIEFFGLLGFNNYGSIKDVSIKVEKLNYTTSKDIKFGTVVATNYGIIKNCVIDLNGEKSKDDYYDKLYIGGVAYYNYNLVEKIIVKLNLNNLVQILQGNKENINNIAAFVTSELNDGRTVSCVAVYDSSKYKFKDITTTALKTGNISISDIITQEIFNKLGFNANRWEYFEDTNTISMRGGGE